MNLELWKKVMKEQQMTQIDLSNKSSVPLQTIKYIFTGRTPHPRIDTINAIEKALGIDDESRIKEIGGYMLNDRYAIPLVGDVVCGRPIESPENLEGYVYIDFKNPDEYFALKVHGDSMINVGITPKSILIVHKQNYADNGDIVVASINKESTIKRYHNNNGIIFLTPENTNYAPIPITAEDEFYIFGKVVQIRTDI